MGQLLQRMCSASTVEAALSEVRAIRSLGSDMWAYAYMRTLRDRSPELYYATLLAHPRELLPVVYTPTVGEACQKYGRLPMQRRGCYVSLADRGRVREVLLDYAARELDKSQDGKYLCDCIVFSDGGRILGLGDLGAWGMGIPMGKLDLYTVCGGFNPKRTVPVIIDAGICGPNKNTDRLNIRDDPLYTGMRQGRKLVSSPAGTSVNEVYYGRDSLIGEFMHAATDVFSQKCLLQFEDFNSNDAFPLLAEHRDKFLTYNDDIQGTAAVAVAGIMGAIKLRDPACKDLAAALRNEIFLFHGAGSANLGAMSLLAKEVGVPMANLFATNSRGIIWRSADGAEGSFRNSEQKEFAQVGKPSFDFTDLVKAVEHIKPTCLIGAVGVQPGCFDKAVLDAMLRVNPDSRPVVFAMSNPKTQTEITAQDAYSWSEGRVIFGSGTMFPPVDINGRVHEPGQVNNVYVFPGLSFGCSAVGSRSVPDRLFRVAAEAVAQSLDEQDMKLDRVVPRVDRIRDVSHNVAAAVAIECGKLGLATEMLDVLQTPEKVKEALGKKMWKPSISARM